MGGFWRPKRHTSQTTPTEVKEETLPRRHYEHDPIEREAMYEELGEAVEMDKERSRKRLKGTLMFVVVAVIVAAIVDIACHDNVRMWLQASFDWIEENPKAGERVQQSCFFEVGDVL